MCCTRRERQQVAEADEYKRLQSVRHNAGDAIKTATDTYSGDILDVDLETRKGTVVWEISIAKPGGGYTQAWVDVVSGKLVS